MWLARLRDPHDMGAMALVAALLLACELVLCVGIVQRIPCTCPPTTVHMQARRGFDQWIMRQPLHVLPARPVQLRHGPAGARMAWGHDECYIGWVREYADTEIDWVAYMQEVLVRCRAEP